MSNVIIKAMSRDDITFIAELEKECFSCPWSREALESELSNPYAAFFSAFENGCPLGYIGSHILFEDATVLNLAVFPNARRAGAATALLGAVKNEAHLRGAVRMTLEVRVSNAPARALYEKEGFVLLGTIKGMYEKPAEDACVYTYELKVQNVNIGS